MPYGDLSRLGRISDTEFGWLDAPATVPAPFLRGSPLDRADVLVIGDSFSMTHRWQSVLVKDGLRVTTIYWGQIGETLCADLGDWLERAGFRGKLVVIESVERLLAERLAATAKCVTMKRPFAARETPFLEPLDAVPGFSLNWGAKLTTGVATWLNTRRAIKTPGATWADLNVRVRPVERGCELFSHRLCGKALFFGEDDDNGELSASHVQAMQSFTTAHRGTPLLWMVVPNKTTVYLEPTHSKAFVDAFGPSGLGPDLFEFARVRRDRSKDFYFPNDTHLSMRGQLALGDLMLQEVRKIVPAATARTP
ncbi:MAG: hypothetical protein EOO22_05280 [Comamonadaceae bacterium]|nr:MAG: hypothetical protein EOO22_05280 [Comamonadaceae bacterium]